MVKLWAAFFFIATFAFLLTGLHHIEAHKYSEPYFVLSFISFLVCVIPLGFTYTDNPPRY